MKPIPLIYLGSYLLSVLGNSIAGIALPLIVLQVTGSVMGAGVVAAATAIPAVLAGAFMGVVIDRINRRTASVVTDLISAAAIAALPLIDLASGLSLGWFVLFGVIGSLGDVPGMTAREVLLPAIVRESGMSAERLLGAREALGAFALILGPAAAGTLITLFEGSTVLWITAGTSFIAALLTLFIPRRVGQIVTDDGAAAVTSGRPIAQMKDGWRTLFSSRFLIATTALSCISVLVLASLQGLILPVYFMLIDRPGMLGFVLTALAIGMLIGGGTYAALGTRGRRRVWFMTGLLGSGVGFALIVLLKSVWVVFAGAFVVGLFSGLFGALIGVLMIERIPEHMRGRIMGTQNALLTVAPPIAIIIAAVLIEYGSINVAAVALGCIWLGAIAIGLFSHALRTLEPEPREESVDTDA